LNESAETCVSDERHIFFVNVLKKVRDILKPCLSQEHVNPAASKTMEDIVSIFEHLELGETFGFFRHTPEVTDRLHSEPIYEAERINYIEESFFALHLLPHDFNRLRSEVSTGWDRYSMGGQELVAAAITTNTAIDLARSMTDELESIFPKHGGAHQMLRIYYAGQCVGAGTLET
jgi:hypothetical protein